MDQVNGAEVVVLYVDIDGNESVAAYQDSLSQLLITIQSDTPDTNNRTIEWIVNDGDGNSSGITSTISVSYGS